MIKASFCVAIASLLVGCRVVAQQDLATPIQVIPYEGEVIVDSTPSPLVARSQESHMVLEETGASNKFGNSVYQLNMYAGGKLVASVSSVAGRSYTQQRDRNVSGTEAPLPNGFYGVDSAPIASSTHEVGGKFLRIYPKFKTGRSALGIHVDPSFGKNRKEDGTQGCIGTTSVEERDAVYNFVRKYYPTYLEVKI